MARRISFIEPVDHMSGKISGNQELVYAKNDNRAFEAPEGRQYARNYKARYIGTYRERDGRTSFYVKKRSAVKIDSVSKSTMAALGAAASLANVITTKAAHASLLETLTTQYNRYKAFSMTNAKSVKSWIVEQLVPAYRAYDDCKIPVIDEDGTAVGSFVQILNQFLHPIQWDDERDPTLPDYIYQKFWSALVFNGFTVKVNGATFLAMFNSETQNPAGTWSTVLTGYLYYSNQYIYFYDIMQQLNAYAQMRTPGAEPQNFWMRKGSLNGPYVKVTDKFEPGANYILTDIAPE